MELGLGHEKLMLSWGKSTHSNTSCEDAAKYAAQGPAVNLRMRGAKVNASRLIRVANRDDAGQISQLLFDFNTEFHSPTPTAAEFAVRLRRLLGLAEVLVLLASDFDGEPIGLALLTFRPTPYFDGPIAQLEDLYVRPAVRGQGIGSTMLTEAIEHVRSCHGGELHVTVDEVDADARRFYERHGFLNIEPGEDYRMLFYLHEM